MASEQHHQRLSLQLQPQPGSPVPPSSSTPPPVPMSPRSSSASSSGAHKRPVINPLLLASVDRTHKGSLPSPGGFSPRRIQCVGHYDLLKTIGRGQFGKVKLARHALTGEKVAVKIIRKTKLDAEAMALVRREIYIMKLLHHPHIIHLYEVLETEKVLFLIMEYASGGEALDFIVAHGRLDEDKARAIFCQVVNAIDYLHGRFIVHRDLKAENLLLDSELRIKLIDFGLSNSFVPGKLLNTFCGSPTYAAPELILKKQYCGPEVDVWSMGVLLYVFVTGALPFNGKDLLTLFTAILNCDYHMPEYLSAGCQDLLRSMLQVDSTKRATISDIKKHPWLAYNDYYQTAATEAPGINDILPNSEPAGLDAGLLSQMGMWGFTIDQVQKSLQERTYDSATATYLLLRNRQLKMAQELCDGLAQVQAQPASAPWVNGSAGDRARVSRLTCSASQPASANTSPAPSPRHSPRSVPVSPPLGPTDATSTSTSTTSTSTTSPTSTTSSAVSSAPGPVLSQRIKSADSDTRHRHRSTTATGSPYTPVVASGSTTSSSPSPANSPFSSSPSGPPTEVPTQSPFMRRRQLREERRLASGKKPHHHHKRSNSDALASIELDPNQSASSKNAAAADGGGATSGPAASSVSAPASASPSADTTPVASPPSPAQQSPSPSPSPSPLSSASTSPNNSPMLSVLSGHHSHVPPPSVPTQPPHQWLQQPPSPPPPFTLPVSATSASRSADSARKRSGSHSKRTATNIPPAHSATAASASADSRITRIHPSLYSNSAPFGLSNPALAPAANSAPAGSTARPQLAAPFRKGHRRFRSEDIPAFHREPDRKGFTTVTLAASASASSSSSSTSSSSSLSPSPSPTSPALLGSAGPPDSAVRPTATMKRGKSSAVNGGTSGSPVVPSISTNVQLITRRSTGFSSRTIPGRGFAAGSEKGSSRAGNALAASAGSGAGSTRFTTHAAPATPTAHTTLATAMKLQQASAAMAPGAAVVPPGTAAPRPTLSRELYATRSEPNAALAFDAPLLDHTSSPAEDRAATSEYSHSVYVRHDSAPQHTRTKETRASAFPERRASTMEGRSRRSGTSGVSSSSNSTSTSTSSSGGGGSSSASGSGGSGGDPRSGFTELLSHIKNLITHSEPGDEDPSQPRPVRSTFNRSSISNKAPSQIIDEIHRALQDRQILYSHTGPCCLEALDNERRLRFELEVCRVPNISDTFFVKMKRIAGNWIEYQKLCNELLSSLALGS